MPAIWVFFYNSRHVKATCEARDLVMNIINCSKPIVSAIHGPAVGAGLVRQELPEPQFVCWIAERIQGRPGWRTKVQSSVASDGSVSITRLLLRSSFTSFSE